MKDHENKKENYRKRKNVYETRKNRKENSKLNPICELESLN